MSLLYLQTPRAVRDRCGDLFNLACADRLEHFRVRLDQLEPTAAFVLEVTRQQYPDLNVPFHSRWRHFEVEGRSRSDSLIAGMSEATALEKAQMQFDLAVVSVLLDAGAGDRWRYVDPETDEIFSRSEGLAIASLQLFKQGLFSSAAAQPWRVDAAGLKQLTLEQLAVGLQHRSENPLVGLEGRLRLLQRLGQALENQPRFFGQFCEPASKQLSPRPGYLVNYLQSLPQPISAAQVLAGVLQGLGEIWPGRTALDGVNLGDVWPHPALLGEAPSDCLVPFHKLSQWLTYSLLEPLQRAGLEIINLDELTGLAEYRNGGLCVDMGLLEPKHSQVLGDRHLPGSPLIVEWRALTVIALDKIAEQIRQQLQLDAAQLPLVKVLQGGTWAAGRQLAQPRGGLPPIQTASDGTVF
ncbi:MAG: URC4/urg3 family protein [Leptolyngbyaceae cyanobacterium SM1_1_3]|nr:URC4/urg3 family protein [Leptolyngbyaceae cyanobacterium SM1_1_3]NJN04687.1 URC4/urg3 family protein [Leptolyngbyaceae cyanobacterium RM1_1_2]NJO11068.1 URC4/urg3 family protein [Leptolyngbyaceae cyanobacterium SL_1_1]